MSRERRKALVRPVFATTSKRVCAQPNSRRRTKTNE